MVTHRVYNKQLSDTIQAQFTYEKFPLFAGSDDFCLLLRLKYNDISSNHDSTGAAKSGKESSPTKTENVSEDITEHQESIRSFSSRLSTQLSNATRSLFLQTLDSSQKPTLTTKTKTKEHKETILLGYCQLLGHYSINESILDYSVFKDIQKETIIEGKYAGIHGLVAPSENNDESDGLIAGLNALYYSELNSFAESSIADKMKFIPFFSSDQQIIFSELEVDPIKAGSHSGDIASFLITCKLPQNLPPTYMTESVQINYNFVFGYQVIEGPKVKTKTVFVPLKIYPYINRNGRQPIYHLEKLSLNMKLNGFNCQNVSKQLSLMRKSVSDHTVSESRRTSFWNLKRTLAKNDIPQMNSNIANLELNENTENVTKTVLDNDVKDFLKTLERLNEADINDIIKVQEEFEKEQNNSKSSKSCVRETLLSILTDTNFLKHTEQESELDSDTEYEQLLPHDQQAKIIIKQNHDCIATMKLNKGVFKLGDYVHIAIAFEQDDYSTTGIEIQLLKHQILRKDCLKKGAYDEVSSRLNENILETILFQKMMNTINTTTISTEVLIPLATEPQFQTNFFTCKYYLQVRFITTARLSSSKKQSELTQNESIEQGDLRKRNNFFKNIFTDSNGSILFKAKERMTNANEFYIRVPIVVLPTYEQDFGLVTTKL